VWWGNKEKKEWQMTVLYDFYNGLIWLPRMLKDVFVHIFQFESVSDDEWIARTTILEGGISLHPLPGLEK
jgi:hypothetical protein